MLINGKPLKFPTHTVLNRLKSNRDTHVADYDDAMVGFNAKRAELYTAVATTMLQGSVNSLDTDAIDKRYQAVCLAMNAVNQLVRPTSHQNDYDRAIDMLSNCSEEEVEMDGQTFDQYMRDEWKWKQAFATSTANYKGK
jgi:hypothetical protein